jgi:hypothetical protein
MSSEQPESVRQQPRPEHGRVSRFKRSFETQTGQRDLPDPTVMPPHNRAERRLNTALASQQRSSDRYDAAIGRSAHRVAEMALHAADQEVAARGAWLHWVDDEHYHGLNAGKFELLAETASVNHLTDGMG